MHKSTLLLAVGLVSYLVIRKLQIPLEANMFVQINTRGGLANALAKYSTAT
jgi:hypothetical protein